MRISTNMIFDAGVSGINRQTASLLQVQQQIASGKRILRPSDDPVAAARALETTQSNEAVAQFKRNQDYATSALGLEEAQLTSAGDVLARVRDLALTATNGALSTSARQGIATELRGRFDQLIGIANTSDGNGQAMFSGFMGAITPFAGAVDGILAGGEMTYDGDDGQRTLQVSPNRFIEASDSGSDVFMRIKNGNGYFSTAYTDNIITGSPNSGTGTINSGSVTDPAAWNAATGQNIAIQFTVAAGVTTYDIVDTDSGTTLADDRAFQPGQTIALTSEGAEAPFDLGASVTIKGDPADGDSFSIAPSTSQSVFVTLANLIGALETTTGTPAANARYSNDVASALTNIDQASDNIMHIRVGIGSRMNEIDSLGELNSSLNLQYQQTLSQLQDIDYAATVSDLVRQQTNLQAAQQSFAKIAGLSLFDYI